MVVIVSCHLCRKENKNKALQNSVTQCCKNKKVKCSLFLHHGRMDRTLWVNHLDWKKEECIWMHSMAQTNPRD